MARDCQQARVGYLGTLLDWDLAVYLSFSFFSFCSSRFFWKSTRFQLCGVNNTCWTWHLHQALRMTGGVQWDQKLIQRLSFPAVTFQTFRDWTTPSLTHSSCPMFPPTVLLRRIWSSVYLAWIVSWRWLLHLCFSVMTTVWLRLWLLRGSSALRKFVRCRIWKKWIVFCCNRSILD